MSENKKPQFDKVYCSQCGGEFGPRDSGYSHCSDHRREATIKHTATVETIARETVKRWERDQVYLEQAIIDALNEYGDSLKARNAELVRALKALINDCPNCFHDNCIRPIHHAACAALANEKEHNSNG
jgi:hypothetical protein